MACVACLPSPRYYEIRSMSGRYASYWNAFLFFENVKRADTFRVFNVLKSKHFRLNLLWSHFKSSVGSSARSNGNQTKLSSSAAFQIV